jgi:hypothetical protein
MKKGQNGQHTMERHVGWSDEQLIDRLNSNKRISAASTYNNEATAQRVVNESIASNRTTINEWLSRAKPGASKEIYYSTNNTIGRGINRGETSIGSRTNSKTILRKTPNGGFDIVTSFPIK